MTASAPFYLVDAFARTPFTGNPAGVVILTEELPAPVMQSIAMEINQAETAFVRRNGDAWELRWFTPATEVDLCGHATLATSAALWDAKLVDRSASIRFSTRSGVLTCTPRGDDIELDFPATPPRQIDSVEGLLSALGIQHAKYIGRSRFDVLVEVEKESLVRSLTPDFRALKAIEARGVMVTAKSDGPPYDFVSRFFAPAAGIDEDPVTGSAHCCLTPYWVEKLGRTEFLAYQASRRGGELSLELRGERVLLRGGSRITLRGEIFF